eukprot:scaffold83991_cov54-Phaeocystis_antarctica.AAC.1
MRRLGIDLSPEGVGGRAREGLGRVEVGDARLHARQVSRRDLRSLLAEESREAPQPEPRQDRVELGVDRRVEVKRARLGELQQRDAGELLRDAAPHEAVRHGRTVRRHSNRLGASLHADGDSAVVLLGLGVGDGLELGAEAVAVEERRGGRLTDEG